MLKESLEKTTRICSPEGINYIASWLSKGLDTADDLSLCVQNHPSIRMSDVPKVLCLFEEMSFLHFECGKIVCCTEFLSQANDTNNFTNWFTKEYLGFILKNNILKSGSLQYCIALDNYVIPSGAIDPMRHACYRNLLIDFGLIKCESDGGYRMTPSVEEELTRLLTSQKMTEQDLLDDLEHKRKLGQRGEEFVLTYERARITNPTIQKQIKRISSIDVAAGFDIVSFKSNDSVRIDNFIEVKTYSGQPHFYWSKNELEKARLMGESYSIYLVNSEQIDNSNYSPICISDPFKNIFQDMGWLKSPETYLVEMSDIVKMKP